MNKKIKSVIVSLTLITSAFALTACNTTRGFGQDLEKLGNEIEEEASN